MATKRTLPLTKQLKVALAEADEHKRHAEKLAKDLETARGSIPYRDKQILDQAKELNDVHAFLDAIPNSPVRDTQGEYSKTVHSLMTRLCVYLSTR